MDTLPAESQEEILLARYFETTPPTSLQPRPEVTQTDSSPKTNTVAKETLAQAAHVFNRFGSLATLEQDDH